MAWLTSEERRSAEALAAIGYTNPFLRKRLELEQQALGREFIAYDLVIHKPPETDISRVFPNVVPMRKRAEALAARMREHLLSRGPANEADLRLYEHLVLYLLFERYDSHFDGLATEHLRTQDLPSPFPFWKEFLRDHDYYLHLPGRKFPLRHEPHHIFATFFQIQRAFHNIFQTLLGRSMGMAELRAAVWQSIFTHDMERYSRILYEQMDEMPTLIQGPSGTGKELVAQAIGRSRYIAFDPKAERFTVDRSDDFLAVNLSALAPGLIESELFGHSKGAFTSATKDRVGYLGQSQPHTCLFLDEIGEVDLAIQVKLLRVLQLRTFQRVGETHPQPFRGKLIAATNRDLKAEIRAGRFREDFYYRLCADLIHTPSLRQQLAERPDDLETLVSLLTRDILRNDACEAARLTEEVVAWISDHLGQDYEWPGNFRELGQCIRNVMIRGTYAPGSPHGRGPQSSAQRELAEAVTFAQLKFSDLEQHYISLVYAKAGTYIKAAEQLGLNWRTVKAKVSEVLASKYRMH
jgi:DNA-binding NtrC family response regulator